MEAINEFTHNGIKYNVWIKEGFNGQQMAQVYKEGETKMPVVGTTFGKMASFKNEIMEWAKKCIAKNFN